MKTVILVCDEDKKAIYDPMLKWLEHIWQVKGYETVSLVIEPCKNPYEYYSYLKNMDADYICSLDMSGFQMNTLLEERAYNLLFAKQLHIIIDVDSFREYLGENYAMNLFFFVPSEVIEDKEYQHIFNLGGYEELTREELVKMVDYLITETEGK